jgi:hypothetical protein
MIDKCVTESAWLHTWKLDAALGNSNFNGDTFTPTNGTYGGIGDVNGYGGGNNAWYGLGHYIPFDRRQRSGGCSGTGAARTTASSGTTRTRRCRRARQPHPRRWWAVLMSNLHETAWHDYLRPDLGQSAVLGAHQERHALRRGRALGGRAHASPTGASGDDDDGINELVIYNERVMGVFESIGGAAPVRQGCRLQLPWSARHAYWAGTEGD